MAKEIIKTNLKDHDLISLTYNGRSVEMTVKDFFASLPSGTLVISNTPAAGTSGIYSGSGYLPANVTVNGLAGYSLYFFAIDEFSVASNVFKLSDIGGTNFGTFNVNSLTDQRTYTFQDASGTIAFLSDIPAANNIYSDNGTVGAGRVATLTDYIAFNGGEFRTQNGYWQGTAKILYINPNGTTANLFVGEDAGNNTLTNAANIGLGYQTLKALTSGTQNMAIGTLALTNNTTGDSNVAIGSTALYSNISGVENIAIGTQSMYANTTGYSNTSVGNYALRFNLVGTNNVAVGDYALNTYTGSQSVAVGYNALKLSTVQGTALGMGALQTNSTGDYNTAIGLLTMSSNTTGTGNTAVGYNASQYNIVGGSNTAVGMQALLNNKNSLNTGIGHSALYLNNSGSSNTSVGAYSTYANTTGYDNIAMGVYSLFTNTTGYQNVALGNSALRTNVVGINNIALGFQSGYYETGSNSLYIHNGLGVTDLATGKSNSLIYGIFAATTAAQQLNINANTNTPIAHYNYMAASNSADTVGDVRFYATYVATVSSFIIEKCTVANAAKGGGTWVNINTFSL